MGKSGNEENIKTGERPGYKDAVKWIEVVVACRNSL